MAQIVEARKDEIPPPVARHPGAGPQDEMPGNSTGLHWEALDEDISVEGLLMGIGD